MRCEWFHDGEISSSAEDADCPKEDDACKVMPSDAAGSKDAEDITEEIVEEGADAFPVEARDAPARQLESSNNTRANLARRCHLGKRAAEADALSLAR